MLYYVFQLIFLGLLLLNWKNSNVCYKILVLLQTVSFLTAPFVANYVIFDTPKTYFNTAFCLINLYLIIAPWRRTNFQTVEIVDFSFFEFYKKILYFVLKITIVINLVVLFIVLRYIPSAAVFKAQLGYTALYNQIPYFGIIFRYTSVTRYLGLLALPICIYYLQDNDYKSAIQAFLLSTSTLIASFAFYSRSQLFSYACVCICLYFYVNRTLDNRIKQRAKKALKPLSLILATVFLGITIGRFASPTMSYYKDRIPDESIIKSSVAYSIFDYTSKGFPNGVMQLEVHENDDVLKGEPLYSDLMLAMSYFNLSSWSSDEYAQRRAAAYNKTELNAGNDAGSFHGYVCDMVKIMGYSLTLIFNLFYYRYVRKKSMSGTMNIKTLTVLAFLLIATCNSCFGGTYEAALYPALFHILISFIYSILNRRIVIRKLSL